MELTEENITRSLGNVGEERRDEVLATFRRLQRKEELLNEQREILKQDVDAFGHELRCLGVRGVVARSSSYKNGLNSALWSTLPADLLQLVFAHLPLPDIIRLRVLCKTYDQRVRGEIPGFTQVCAEANPNLFGVLCEDRDFDRYPEQYNVIPYDGIAATAVKLYDVDSDIWHRFYPATPFYGNIEMMHAGDGGLVCVVSVASIIRQHLRIVVLNPLTRQEKELPKLPHALNSVPPCMVQLAMDRNSKCYKVIVVCPKQGGGVGPVFTAR